jgi:hypothetical protein
MITLVLDAIYGAAIGFALGLTGAEDRSSRCRCSSISSASRCTKRLEPRLRSSARSPDTASTCIEATCDSNMVRSSASWDDRRHSRLNGGVRGMRSARRPFASIIWRRIDGLARPSFRKAVGTKELRLEKNGHIHIENLVSYEYKPPYRLAPVLLADVLNFCLFAPLFGSPFSAKNIVR